MQYSYALKDVKIRQKVQSYGATLPPLSMLALGLAATKKQLTLTAGPQSFLVSTTGHRSGVSPLSQVAHLRTIGQEYCLENVFLMAAKLHSLTIAMGTNKTLLL